MKYFGTILTLCAYLTPTAILAACATLGQHTLSEVAESLPRKIECGPRNAEAVSTLITQWAADPEGTWEHYKQVAKSGPEGAASVVCLLLDVEASLLEAGERGSDAYKAVQEALAALGIQ
jgi:hypothetical protein